VKKWWNFIESYHIETKKLTIPQAMIDNGARILIREIKSNR